MSDKNSVSVWEENVMISLIQHILGRGKLGLGQKKEAAGIFSDILKKQTDHQGALEHVDAAR